MTESRAGARDVALRIVLAWETSRQTADVLLDRLLARAELSPRDHDLVIELVRGVFRWRGRLDWQLEQMVDRPLAELHPPILWILRLGLYQLTLLDRIPAHAAVSSSVDLAKRYGHRGSAALVNAVLRRAPERVEAMVEPDAARDPVGHLAARTSHPQWILERWLKRFGFAGTLRLAARNNERPSVTLRAMGDRASAEDLLADLRELGIEAEPGLYVPETVRIPRGWHPRLREILDAGIAMVQDEGAALVAIASRPMPRASVLDVCAAPGGKAIHFALLCGEANVIAADRSLDRLRMMRPPPALAESVSFHSRCRGWTLSGHASIVLPGSRRCSLHEHGGVGAASRCQVAARSRGSSAPLATSRRDSGRFPRGGFGRRSARVLHLQLGA